MFQKVSLCSEENVEQLDQLGDLDLVDTFDETSFDRLMSLADSSQRFRELILNHTAISKYHINEKFVTISTEEQSDGTSLEKIELSGNAVDIYGVDSALKFLRIFGPIISRITKDFPYDNEVLNPEIDRFVNKYCSDSLERLKLFSKVDTADAWKKPFKQLTNLFVHGKLENCEHTNFSEMFPMLSTLQTTDVDILITPDHQQKLHCFKDHHFPHVRVMHFGKIGKNEMRFFEMNPQLQMIQVSSGINIDTLSLACEKLPNLEFMQVEWLTLKYVTSNQLKYPIKVRKCLIRIDANRTTNFKKFDLITSKSDCELLRFSLNWTWQTEGECIQDVGVDHYKITLIRV